jgi:dTDP-4-dehydrorhamnose 3,5-epimerase
MVQGNCSLSKMGVLRGLHFHRKQADFWSVPTGLVRAALYDLRASSPTRGASHVLDLGDGAGNARGLYIPKGVAHGFYALKDSFMTYLVDEYYDSSDELGVRWDDPALAIDWGLSADAAPIVSERDQQNPALAEIPDADRPR